MKLTYIYHSGFAVETNGFSILIDYYKDSTDDESLGFVHKYLLNKPEKLYILSSHSHADHFNPEILKWKSIKENIVYIFSKDILEERKAELNDAVYLDKLGIFEDENIKIKAFGSTDLGISFLLEIGEKIIFHAGDLNNWHWNEESTPDEIKEAEEWYLRELKLLSGEVRHIDLAMFPVDPRLGKDYMKGAEQFVSTIKTDIFSPMHFWERYDEAAAFAPIAKKYHSKCICWNHRGEEFDF